MNKFFFPTRPYKIQEEFCEQALKLYNDEYEIGVFQSPTGTGKTLSVLCSTISWLNNSFFNNIKENNEKNDSLPAWVLKTINKQKEEFSNTIVNNKKLFYEYIKNEILYSTNHKSLDDIFLELEISLESIPEHYKILISSRTHSQLSQYIDEFKKIKNSYNDKIIDYLSIVPIASRTQLCIHNKVRKYNSFVIKDICHNYTRQSDANGDKCTFKESSTILAKKCLLEPYSIDELHKLGLELKACPYYATKIASRFSDIILLPYNVVFNKVSRDSFKIKLNKNTVLVIDEAHNLINAIESSNRASITLKSSFILFKACERIESLSLAFLKGENISLFKQLIRLIKSIYFGIKNLTLDGKKRKNDEDGEREKCIILNPVEFITLNKIDSFNLSKIYNFIIEQDLCRKVKTTIIRYQKELLESRCNDDLHLYSNSMFNFKEFIDILIYSDKKFDIIQIEPLSDNKETQNVSITIIPINIQSRFSEVSLNIKKTMLVGGTLEPISEFLPLFNNIGADKILKYSANHHISKDNVLFLTIPRSIDGQIINLKYDFRTCEIQLRNISQILASLSSEIPDGICAFFTSYAFLEIFYKHLCTSEESREYFNVIKKNKKIFREKRDQNENLLEQYKNYIMNEECKEGGAILLAVLNGTLSEGVNFSDKLCRGLIIISLPFPQTSKLLTSKENYFRESVEEDEELYAKIICMKTVNQCIGRAIRHKDDYSAIILIDHRYENKSIKRMLPSWLRNHINAYSEWNFEKNVVLRIREFFGSK